MAAAPRSRGFSFTYNNYDDAGIARIQALACKYLVYGKEVAESGILHLQGMITFKDGKTLSAAIKLLPGCHVEATKDAHASMVYCKKDGDIYESGTAPKTPADGGEMNADRYKRAWDAAKAGDLDDIDPDLRIRHYGTFKRIKEDYQVQPDIMADFDFHWWYGATGTGKSKRAHAENPDAYLKGTHKWWDGYSGQSTVIIDEWPLAQDYMAHYMKKWCDHYPFLGEIKGGTRLCRPAKIIVTSNYSIEECFPNANDYEPLKRRFQVVNFSPDQGPLFRGAMGDLFSDKPIPSAADAF